MTTDQEKRARAVELLRRFTYHIAGQEWITRERAIYSILSFAAEREAEAIERARVAVHRVGTQYAAYGRSDYTHGWAQCATDSCEAIRALRSPTTGQSPETLRATIAREIIEQNPIHQPPPDWQTPPEERETETLRKLRAALLSDCTSETQGSGWERGVRHAIMVIDCKLSGCSPAAKEEHPTRMGAYTIESTTSEDQIKITPAAPDDPFALEAGRWTCACGYSNLGESCSRCSRRRCAPAAPPSSRRRGRNERPPLFCADRGFVEGGVEMSEWTKEPWLTLRDGWIKAGGLGIGEFFEVPNGEEFEHEKNAQRCCICVNACEGISDPQAAIEKAREILLDIQANADVCHWTWAKARARAALALLEAT